MKTADPGPRTTLVPAGSSLAEHTRGKQSCTIILPYTVDKTRWIVTSRFKQLTPPNLPHVNRLPAVCSSGAGVATPSMRCMPPNCGEGSVRAGATARAWLEARPSSSAAVDASVVGGSAVFGAVLVAPEDARWVGRLAHLAAHARHHLRRRVVMVEVAHAPAPATGYRVGVLGRGEGVGAAAGGVAGTPARL